MEALQIKKGDSQDDQAKEVDEVIEMITGCIDRGSDQGRCHVFLDKSDVCACGRIDLTKARMK